MVAHISSYRSINSKGEDDKQVPSAPQGKPERNFQEIKESPKEDKHYKQQEDDSLDGQQDSPSLFDLSRSNKSKPQALSSQKTQSKDSFLLDEDDPSPKEEFSSPIANELNPLEHQNASISFKETSDFSTSQQSPYEATTFETQTLEDGQIEQKPQAYQPPNTLDNMTRPDTEKIAQISPLSLHTPQAKNLKKSDNGSIFKTKLSNQISSKPKATQKETSKLGPKRETSEAFHTHASPIHFPTEKIQNSEKIVSSRTVGDLADQIIDRIQVMHKGHETQTTITLRHPPVLEGATITLTTSNNLKNNLNISFANLSPEAKALLDRKLAEDPLTTRLASKGIIVQRLTTSTQMDVPLLVDTGQTFQDRQQQQQTTTNNNNNNKEGRVFKT